MIYPVSMAVGVVTRSTVAAILLTTIFFVFNGLVHVSWGWLEPKETETAEPAEEPAQELAPKSPAEPDSPYLTLFRRAVVALHVVLPKTSDADVMARALRKEVNPPLFRDAPSPLCLFRAPPGTRVAEAGVPAELAGPGARLRTLLGEPRFALEGDAPDERLRYTLFRRPRASREVERGGKPRAIPESGTSAAKELLGAVEEDEANGDVERRLVSFGSSSDGVPTSASTLRWSRDVGGTPRARAAVLIPSSDEWMHTLWIEDDSGHADRMKALLDGIDRSMGLDGRPTGARPLSFSGSWKRNIFFSVGSSLAFASCVLLFGWWRLARIEF
jgi:hypothetical protein